MMSSRISSSSRLVVVIGISSCFFLLEISVGFYTHSLALVADALHYLNDLLGFVVALIALKLSETDNSNPDSTPSSLSFGWQRARVLGAFSNGVLLLALAISIFLQSLERFISVHHIDNPMLIFIMGCVGLVLNLVSVLCLHEHDHGHGHYHNHNHNPEQVQPPLTLEIPLSDNTSSTDRVDSEISKHHDHKHLLNSTKSDPENDHKDDDNKHGRRCRCYCRRRRRRHDLGTMGVLLHVLADAANNLGVMASALVIWLAKYDGRFYADPAASMGIAVMILLSALPVVRRSGWILLESVPGGIEIGDVKHDLEKIPSVLSVRNLHIWTLNQHKTLASVHIVLSKKQDNDDDDDTTTPSTTSILEISEFQDLVQVIRECFVAYGVDAGSVTVQPEFVSAGTFGGGVTAGSSSSIVPASTAGAGAG